MSIQRVVGVIIFLVVWVLLLKNEWRRLPLGRAMSALLGAAAFVCIGILDANAALAAINMQTIALLTGCMLISAYLDKEGFFMALGSALSSRGTRFGLLIRVAAISGFASALLTNDTTCVILTPVIGKSCLHRKINPAPYLLALATSSNIGSACSPIGNPQNMIIALASGLTFLQFLGFILFSSVVGTIINVVYIAWVYKKDVFLGNTYDWSQNQMDALQDGVSAAVTPVTPSIPAEVLPTSFTDNDGVPIQTAAAESADLRSINVEESPVSAPNTTASAPVRTSLRKKLIRLVTLCTPFALLVADKWIGLAWMTILIACVLAVLDGEKPDAVVNKVDGNLLLFFSGLFIVVAGFNATKVPESVWNSVGSHIDMDSARGLLVYTMVILIGSNTVSNVPLVLLLQPKLQEMEGDTGILAWALLAYVSTVAGNLTLLGSVANLIVAERAKKWYSLTFKEYLYIGTPSTIVLCMIGVPAVRWCTKALL